jgi:hypothetical protein
MLYVFHIFLFFFFGGTQVFALACATPSVHFALVILEMGVLEIYLPGLASNYNPPDLSLPSS